MASSREKSMFVGRRSICGSLKGSAATATANGVGILDAKTGAGQVIRVVNRCAVQIGRALGINHYFDSFPLEHMIVVMRFIERHAVLHSGATSALDKNPESFAGVVLFASKRLELPDG